MSRSAARAGVGDTAAAALFRGWRDIASLCARFYSLGRCVHFKNEDDAHDLRQRGKELQRYVRKKGREYEAYSNLLADGHLDGSASIEFAQIAGTL
jgi:hypothetical protein